MPIAALVLAAGLVLGGCQSIPDPDLGSLGERLDIQVRALAAPGLGERQRARAEDEQRDLLIAHLPGLIEESDTPTLVQGSEAGVESPGRFSEIHPVRRSRPGNPGLHRAGLGLPAVGHIQPGGPNAPRAGFHVPLTLVALPGTPPTRCCDTALVDPDAIGQVRTGHGDLPIAMDLEAPLSLTSSSGPRLGTALVNLVRPGAFRGEPRIVFLQPFDANKTPVVLVHGLLSTPRLWERLVKDLMADPGFRDCCQVWAFYYPTGQPVPLSALQLRYALDDAVLTHRPRKPMILLGHSMGGILSRAQVSRITLEQAREIVADVGDLPKGSLIRRSLVFEPRTDVSRVVFMFTPHRGSRLASSGVAAWGIRLIRLPDTLLNELTHAAEYVAGIHGEWLPTSIQGLSPDSRFLRVLDSTRPVVPSHSILGDRGRSPLETSSDGVVPYSSAHLPLAESQLVVPTGHGGFDHPDSVAEIKRIIQLAVKEQTQVKASGPPTPALSAAGR